MAKQSWDDLNGTVMLQPFVIFILPSLSSSKCLVFTLLVERPRSPFLCLEFAIGSKCFRKGNNMLAEK